MAEEARTWPSPTDNERLDAAFSALHQAGIFAEQNLPCCRTCADEAVRRAAEEAKRAGRPWRGYVYFHEQDTEGAVKSGVLPLAFGSFVKDQSERILRKAVADALRGEGLVVDWEGLETIRIEVKLKWQTRPAAEASTVSYAELRCG